ncbi:response regulator transcription factor [Flexithrix dorotheae]|uniref:response regulator transcription factor n=1 Tax=Flexithrix dorotheae TaxID=70993 RepID=UPI00037E8936|nr:response regulator transcription factor [Flexithrix dorotheae]
MEQIKVILADDHEIVRNGIKVLLEREGEIKVIGEASNGQEALELVKELNPDILIVDIRMPILNGIETTAQLGKYSSHTKALVLSMHDDEEYITKSIECGASGYLLKDTNKSEFIKAVKAVHSGQKYFSGDISNILINSYLNVKKQSDSGTSTAPAQQYDLTKREKQILKLLYDGANNKDIADHFNKSVRTIETHRFNMMKKLKVNNVVELLRKVDEEKPLKDEIDAMVI